MNSKIALNFAFKNLRANKIFVVPFLISSIIMSMLFFIMVSLQGHEYVMSRHGKLVVVMRFASLLIAIFTFVFMLYSNRFLIENRNKEFALYEIMGLEKSNILKMIRIEYFFSYIIISSFSIIGGFIFGKLFFLALNSLMKDIMVKVMKYNFSTLAMMITAVFLFIVFIFLYISANMSVGKSTPIELLTKKKIEKEARINILLLVLGVLSLSLGYYIAIITKGTIETVDKFLVAVLLVIIGTYCLFISLSVVILKLLKRRKNFYYKDKNFLSISVMIHRIKSNAVVLASIAILSTCIIVTISGVFTVNSGTEKVIDSIIGREYQLQGTKLISIFDEKRIIKEKQNIKNAVNTSVRNGEEIKNLVIEEITISNIMKNGDEFVPFDISKKGSFEEYKIIVNILEDYNIKYEKNLELKDNEILITSNVDDLGLTDEITMMNRAFKVKNIEEDIPRGTMVKTIRIILKDYKTRLEFLNFYKMVDFLGNSNEASVYFSAIWDVENEREDYFADANYYLRKVGYVNDRDNVKHSVYSINGGLLFLGIIMGIIFLIGNILITYYKQISEAYEDREKFKIMKQVGLPDKLIKKSMRTQILTMFFLPLAVSVVHCLFATKILFQFLAIFGIREFNQYFINLSITIGVFGAIYLIIYLITSKLWYKIIIGA